MRFLKKGICTGCFLLSFVKLLYSQETQSFDIPKQTEFVIPPSPAFQLLDGTTALVNTPGVIRDFKVDWSFKTYRLAPNLSIEAQPVWSIFYNRPTLDKYQKAGKFLQSMSTLNLSVGTIDANDTTRLFAWAGKMTIWRGYDPLASSDWYSEIKTDYELQRSDLEARLNEAKENLKMATDRFAKDSLELVMSQLRDQLDQLKITSKNRIKEKQEFLKSRYWNRSAIDVAFGRSYFFNRSITERIDSIKLSSRSMGVWINGAFGIGRHGLVTALARWENINLLLPDSGKTILTDFIIDELTGDTLFAEQRDSLFVNFNEVKQKIFSFGLNFRFGSPRHIFFIEGFYTRNEIPTFEEAQWTDFSGYGPKGRKKSAIVRKQVVFAFGGEWRAGNNVVIYYGIRSVVDKNLRFRNVLPLVNISCLMR